jgi:hypothetical protein
MSNMLTANSITLNTLKTGFLNVNGLALFKVVQCVGSITAPGPGSATFGVPQFSVGNFFLSSFSTGLTFPANHSGTTNYQVRISGAAAGTGLIVGTGTSVGTASTITVLSNGSSSSTVSNVQASLYVSIPVNTVFTLTALSSFTSFLGSVSVVQLAQ